MHEAFSAVCPYCRKPTKITAAILTSVVGVSDGYGGTRGATEQRDATHRWYQYGSKQWWIGECNACHKPLLVGGPGHDVHPTLRPEPVDARIPAPMNADLTEARQCFTVEAFNAAVVMARRALQCAAVVHKAPKNRKLEKQIEDLAERHVISPSEKEMCDVTRWIGNLGAHADTEDEETFVTGVTREEAAEVLDLVSHLFQTLFVVPRMVASRKEKLGKSSPPG